jgi:hypothetical protein
MENGQEVYEMSINETAKELGIGLNLFNEFSVCMETMWSVAHSLDKITLIQLIVKDERWGMTRDDVYNRCADDLQFMKEMYVEMTFVNVMADRGILDKKSTDRKMWDFINYWREL